MGFLGPNGTGKTTTMRMITGFISPDNGSITTNGKALDKNLIIFRILIVYLPEKAKIESIYDFMRDETKFGYNVDDTLPASQVLLDGYGQCNTKGVLFMALLRAVGIPCRMHGFAIHKELQKGAITGIWYKLSPKEITHSWVEIFYKDKWLNMEGFILDSEYLKKLQMK